MSDQMLRHPGELRGLPPGWVEPKLWEIPSDRLSPDKFRYRALGDELRELLAGEGPFISSEGSFLAFAYLHETGENLAWRLMLVHAGEDPEIPGAYACVKVSMGIRDRFLVEAYNAERKQQRRRATLSLPEEDRERCEEAAYMNYVTGNMQSWLRGARKRALRWRPPNRQYELPAPIGLDRMTAPFSA